MPVHPTFRERDLADIANTVGGTPRGLTDDDIEALRNRLGSSYDLRLASDWLTTAAAWNGWRSERTHGFHPVPPAAIATTALTLRATPRLEGWPLLPLFQRDEDRRLLAQNCPPSPDPAAEFVTSSVFVVDPSSGALQEIGTGLALAFNWLTGVQRIKDWYGEIPTMITGRGPVALTVEAAVSQESGSGGTMTEIDRVNEVLARRGLRHGPAQPGDTFTSWWLREVGDPTVTWASGYRALDATESHFTASIVRNVFHEGNAGHWLAQQIVPLAAFGPRTAPNVFGVIETHDGPNPAPFFAMWSTYGKEQPWCPWSTIVHYLTTDPATWPDHLPFTKTRALSEAVT